MSGVLHRLHSPVFSYSTEPLDADDWLRSIERKLQAGHVADGDSVSYAIDHLEGVASSWWENFLNMRPVGPPTTWDEFCTSFHEHHIPKGLMDPSVRSSATSPKVEGLLTSLVVSSTDLLVMLLKKSPPTQRSKRGSVVDSILDSVVSSTCMTLPPSRSLSTKPSRQRT